MLMYWRVHCAFSPICALSCARLKLFQQPVRKTVAEFMEAGGGIEEVNRIDQSRFNYLENYDQLKTRNAQKIYEEIEFE